MEEIVRELNRLKTEIDSAKSDRSQLIGARGEHMKIIQDFGVDTVDKAKEVLVKLDKKKLSLVKEIEAGFKKLKEEYDW